MHSHVEYLTEPAAIAVVRVFPNALYEVEEDDEGMATVGAATGMMTVSITSDVIGREGEVTSLAAFQVPMKLLRTEGMEITELDDLEELAQSILAMVGRVRNTMNMMAAMQD